MSKPSAIPEEHDEYADEAPPYSESEWDESDVDESDLDESDLDESESDDPDAEEDAEPARKSRWWLAPFRWIRKAASELVRPIRALIRPVRALVRSPFRLIKTVFMATIGKNRGFGFWWLVATLALAVAIGLILAVLLSPVLGLLAAIGVAIWMLVRRSGSADGDDDAESDKLPADGTEPHRASA